MRTARTPLSIGIWLIALWVGLPAQAHDRPDAAQPGPRCEAEKVKEASRYHACLMNARFRAIIVGRNPERAMARCDARFGAKWPKIEGRGGDLCPSVGDEESIQSLLAGQVGDVTTLLSGGTLPECGNAVIDGDEQCDAADLGGEDCTSLGYTVGGTLSCSVGCGFDTSLCLAQAFPATGQTTCWDSLREITPCAGTGHDGDSLAGAPLAYQDNANGTITDLNTGLMWEKLSRDGSIHDWDNTYIWIDTLTFKIGRLNALVFAGHRDWRMPNRKELESIINLEVFSPSVSPAFHTGCAPGCTVHTCSCTASSFYWSSSSSAFFPVRKWVVEFNRGNVFSISRREVRPARAVRGPVPPSLCLPGTQEVGGACWHIGASDESCDQTCSVAGLSYDPATETYAGSGGGLANCNAVMAAFSFSPTIELVSCSEGLGCYYDSFFGVGYRCAAPPTTSLASNGNLTFGRFCACQ